MKDLVLKLEDLPESLGKQLIATARKRSLTKEQRRVLRAADALKKAGVEVNTPDFPLPDAVIIKLK